MAVIAEQYGPSAVVARVTTVESIVHPDGSIIDYHARPWHAPGWVAYQNGQRIGDPLTPDELNEHRADAAADWAANGWCPQCAWDLPNEPDPGNMVVVVRGPGRADAECSDCDTLVIDRDGQPAEWHLPADAHRALAEKMARP